MKTRALTRWTAAGAAMLAAALFTPAASYANHLEARMIGVSTWDAECSANTLTYWDDMVRFWYNEIDNHGWWHRAGSTVDGNLNGSKFCDIDHDSPCEDFNYIDDADAVMIFMHGFDAGSAWGGVLRRNTGPDGDCDIVFPQGSETEAIYAGDVDAEFLHMSSCNSLDADNVATSWTALRDPSDPPNWAHSVSGFHGFMWIGGCCDDQYEDFAADAHSVSIKDAWMDNMLVTGINGYATQCPVIEAVGAPSLANCFSRIDTERYNNVKSDPQNATHYCFYYYPGCDPEGEGPF